MINLTDKIFLSDRITAKLAHKLAFDTYAMCRKTSTWDKNIKILLSLLCTVGRFFLLTKDYCSGNGRWYKWANCGVICISQCNSTRWRGPWSTKNFSTMWQSWLFQINIQKMSSIHGTCTSSKARWYQFKKARGTKPLLLEGEHSIKSYYFKWYV